ncbi:riboflavin kinase / FMN adenylyltransferase [Thermotomaculum hydrothermale]|uniref:Riboflavin biosynthesis protein n=1 Tax=Thermotomaculum hydrothermale TaxID=981385 RepID=A0A7R6PKK8_9BACT|nr:bifunctional riboflavin kinase/FAD synthetase [Thermotomaculum hydrothermale]BBB31867.1 riboflavin kinase / FMN adenylyltransferase [Thermotomaculum hydrothermale]
MKTFFHRESDFSLNASVVTIGNFDGVHLGHQKIINLAKESAEKMQLPLVVVSFDPHPGKVLYPANAPKLIKTRKQKRDLLRKMGVDYFYVINFTPSFAKKSPEEFVDEVLIDSLGAKKVFVGFNFAFGRDRSGDLSFLKKQGEKKGFDVIAVPPVKVDGEIVSSSLIRKLLEEGMVKKANKFLGRHYYLEGIVIHGEQRGRKIGFPTANIITENELVPRLGVYASYTKLNSINYPSITNIGYKPTFGSEKIIVETYIFDFDREIYGELIEVKFVDFIRPEKKFSGVDELVKEIKANCEQCKNILKRNGFLEKLI